MHIQPSSPNSSHSEDDAATKIQAGFRGYRVRKQMRQSKNASGTNSGGVSGSSQSRQTAAGQQRSPKAGKKHGASLEDNSATKIQAGVRGFLVRKRQKMATEAATKIQAGFRGFKTRKELKTIKKEK